MAASFSYFVTAATKFWCCSSNKKKCLLRFFSLALDLSRPFSRWPSLACSLTFSFSLSFSCSVFQICRHAGQWIQAEYFRQHGYRNNFRFPFSSLLTLSLLYKTPEVMRFPAKITSSCIWVAIPVDWVILHWYAFGVDGRSLGWSLYGHVITKFSRMGRLLHFLTHGARLARFARESSAIIEVLARCVVIRGSSWWEGFMTHAVKSIIDCF